MTAYALLTYLERGLGEEAFPIMQWLIEQRNSNGGFASTQVRPYRVMGKIMLAQLTLYT